MSCEIDVYFDMPLGTTTEELQVLTYSEKMLKLFKEVLAAGLNVQLNVHVRWYRP